MGALNYKGCIDNLAELLKSSAMRALKQKIIERVKRDADAIIENAALDLVDMVKLHIVSVADNEHDRERITIELVIKKQEGEPAE